MICFLYKSLKEAGKVLSNFFLDYWIKFGVLSMGYPKPILCRLSKSRWLLRQQSKLFLKMILSL
ncbi:hypothetical protein BpHYR1_035482 [Brachionus plicatilis]|uniref:Uncharacterized protein n=1 Tax=Brachionus plicatilis TaxID=10195 RepID=A0A3M7RR46_BRAPC|nr:hypothetical protein BpHYR1_035482 [Brachionus plicatilis]